MKIFVLEDNENRIKWFQERLIDFDLAKTAEEGIRLIQENVYDMIFLDHDLGDRIFVDSNDSNTGFQVAKCIALTPNKEAKIITHTMNPIGAQNIKDILPNCTYVPFCFLNINVEDGNGKNESNCGS